MKSRKTAVVICPGRGTYNASELGYLNRYHSSRREQLERYNIFRANAGQETLSALDSTERYDPFIHTDGGHASPLIFTSSFFDFQSIDRERVDIVAVTGNSMGWYIALTCGGALEEMDGFELVNTMGTLMQERLIGGQLVYPVTSEDWSVDCQKRIEVEEKVQQIAGRDGHELMLSIDLGGMFVLAGNETGLSAFEKEIPKLATGFPLRLKNHAAFHTPLQTVVSDEARERFSVDMFRQPELPLIDGQGRIWWPGSSGQEKLWDYTLNHQIVEPYNFASAVACAAREFAPDLFIVTGPGNTLGGSVAQSLIAVEWRGMNSKSDFLRQQEAEPLLVSMGLVEQRPWVTN